MFTHALLLHLLQGSDWNSSLIAFTDKEPKDFMVPSRWGTVSSHLLCW